MEKEFNIEEAMRKFVKAGLLKKTKKGYIYPSWLKPYSNDIKLMRGILKICQKKNLI